ncbi:unnamed protein product, partial [Meganyctiphanes norvegica]
MTLHKKASAVSREAHGPASLLEKMGHIVKGTQKLILQFSGYVSQMLDDARVYANYAKKSKNIEMDDVKLAVHMMMEKSFTTPPPRDLLLDLSRTRNANPLPAIKAQCGIRLPPDRYCLSACNYRLKTTKKKIPAMGANTRINLNPGSSSGGMKISATPMKPTFSTVTTKTGNTQTVTLVQKPAASAAIGGPTQKIVSVNRPVFKVTPGPPGGITPKIQLSAGGGGGSNVMVNMSSVGGTGVKLETEALGIKRKREDED